MTHHLFIQPLDVWLFRNGKPFNQGSDHRAESVFPPLPTVLQGAIRSHYVELHGGIPAYLEGQSGLEDKVGHKGGPPPAGFQLRGPFLADCQDDQVRCYVPLPAHAYLDGDTYRLREPKTANEMDVITNLEANYHLLWRKAEVKPSKGEGGGWLSSANLHTLLHEGELDKSSVEHQGCFFERESRLGIQLNDQTRATATGMLYEAEFVRLKDGYGLYVAVDGLALPDSGVMGLGGESHAAIYKNVSGPTYSELQPGKNGFTLTFITPTYFENGWQPAARQKFLGDSVTCVAAAVSKPLVLGGFDLAHKRHKPSRRYIPAGSTYFFTGTPLDPRPPTICDDITEFGITFNPGQIGFGQYSLGGW
jgi:CRISPR-associated protein Cmr3